MMCGPDVHIRYSHAHRHKLQKEVDGVQYQRFHASLFDLLGQLLERCLKQPWYHLSARISHHVQAVQLRYPTQRFPNGSHRILTLAEGDKPQISCPNRGFTFRKTDKDHLITARFYLAC